MNREQRRQFIRSQFAARKLHYDKFFPEAVDSVILLDRKKVGRLILLRGEDEFRIITLEVHPKFREEGINEEIIRDIQTQAIEAEKPIRVQIEKLGGWFDMLTGLGFSKTGSTDTHFQMEWSADVAQQNE